MRDSSPVTLYCFAHAGAGVSGFAHWRTGTGPGVRTVPVLLPGRGARRREARITSREGLLDTLLEPLAEQVADGRPYVLYGHSLGGLVAYTLARALRERGLPAPACLAVGASPPPQFSPPCDDDLSDGLLLRFAAGLGAAPGGALAAPGSLWYRRVLPLLRDDLKLAAALRAGALADPGGPLPVPVLAVGGQADPVVGPAVLEGWARWTTGRFVRRTVPGDHFFVRGPHAPRLLGRACRVVRRTRLVPGLISGGQL
ncbi:thioesterase II family protein [Streptomyces mexicanus]|jgi:surfactin synthase thioesterase subunit|uniref:Alpha/beta fold hydrolase n=1 Tax=Streptomyces mexicanus TaxID=178566 RepID=A0A7X1LTM6_9ACTN|nr:alpha/beta fold hydrolase [Streptomyces mexicanus]MBC2869425.1 alpha/beta fold hydrolase [Streptomyces mexicanus]